MIEGKGLVSRVEITCGTCGNMVERTIKRTIGRYADVTTCWDCKMRKMRDFANRANARKRAAKALTNSVLNAKVKMLA